MDQDISNELPPVHNQPDALSYGFQATEKQQSVAIEHGAASSYQQPVPVTLSQPQAQVPQHDPATAVPMPPAAAQASPAIADDTDLIEKEWVARAKQIVEQTKHDPYQQNKEVEKFKADYLKKRYNKDIRLTDD